MRELEEVTQVLNAHEKELVSLDTLSADPTLLLSTQQQLQVLTVNTCSKTCLEIETLLSLGWNLGCNGIYHFALVSFVHCINLLQ